MAANPKQTMTPEFAVELVKTLMWQAVMMALPLLLTAMVVGLAISLFQSVTSIQEQTLAFVKSLEAEGFSVMAPRVGETLHIK